MPYNGIQYPVGKYLHAVFMTKTFSRTPYLKAHLRPDQKLRIESIYNMYKEHYQFIALPFAEDSDLNFIFLGQNYETSLAMLVTGLDKGLYLHAVLGEDGVGTTTFVKYVEKHIQHSCSVGFIDKEVESSSALLQFALESFGQKAEIIELPEMVEQLRTTLKVAFEKNNQQPSILIIDNVHKMPAEVFQAINLLTSIDFENRKLLQLILAGNNDLQEILRGISEKVEILWHHLNPLTAQETRNYIQHRLKIAGSTDKNLFNEQVCAAIFEYSKGIPEKINSLCHRLLLFSSTHQLEDISTAHIQQFTDDVKPSEKTSSPLSNSTVQITPGFSRKAWVSGVIFAGIGLALGFILSPYLTNPEETQIVASNETITKQENDQQKWLDTLSGKTPDIETKIVQEILSQKKEPLNHLDNSQQASIPSQNRQVEELLAVAEQQLLESKLLTPSNNNAYETYTAILAIITNEKRAISGLQQIADRYLTLATNSFDQGNFSRSKILIARGLKARPKHEQLIVLSKEINDFDLKIQEQNQKAEILLKQGEQQLAALKLISPNGDNAYQTLLKVFTIDKTNQQAEQDMQEIQHLLSFQLRENLIKKQYDSAWALVKQVLSAPNKEYYLQDALATASHIEKRLKDKITYLLALAKQQEKLQQFIQPDSNNATETYRIILGINHANSDAKQGLENIAKQYRIATKYAFENGKTKQALIYANEAVAAFPDNLALLELQSKISLSLSEQSRASGSLTTEDSRTDFKKRLRPFGNF